jgi:hypothetical protein
MATSRILPKDIAIIARRSDAGEKVADIAIGMGISARRIYEVLREHRPNRERSSRIPTGEMSDKILAMAKVGSKPRSIAQLLKVSRQYVYRILSERD